MNIIVAPDKFKGSLSTFEVIEAISTGIRWVNPETIIHAVPMADGGEGTMQIMTEASKGTIQKVSVRDPLDRIIEAEYGYSKEQETAFIEMAAASGLHLLSRNEYNPLLTSTFGTGQIIQDALLKGAKKIVLGIGGSATTDAGIGMAAALGYRFYDDQDVEVLPIGGMMRNISKIDTSMVLPQLQQCKVVVACDVTNPLLGQEGAAAVYGPQKGASPEMIPLLEQGLERISNLAKEVFHMDIHQKPGSGAAGGLGAGCQWFLGGELQEGVKVIMELSNLENLIQSADLVITGEGRVDQQTLQGKVVKGLANLCNRNQVPLAVLCGSLSISAEELETAGITYASSILDKPMDLDTALSEASDLLTNATIQLVRLFSIAR
ncbi:glycerate kinase [Dyadobacter tibetensis]|uniref:glycerate kinase n=1 Tax=Dyadobacter tibetensis TaxID=1211851 RepID=UPI00047276AA|nr:glycerate kinase [Dyadobacter tibetensis]